MACITNQCGVGGWGGTLPGDPNNSAALSAVPAFGGIDVTWTYPTVRPEAVAHTLLYRSTVPVFTSAVEIAVVNSSFYYDKLNNSNRYYYWIRFVSVNATLGEPIGPATAQANPTIQNLLELMTGQINEGLLATTLRTEIGRIDTNYQEYLDDNIARLSKDAAFSKALAEVQSGVQGSMTYLSQEITNRRDGDSALLSQINTLFAANKTNTALLTNSYYTKVQTDAAIAVANTSLLAQARTEFPSTAYLSNTYLTKAGTQAAISAATLNLVSTGTLNTALGSYASQALLRNEMTTNIGYSVLLGTSTPFDGDKATVIYPADVYSSAEYPEYANNRYRIIDKNGVDRWNATPAGRLKSAEWIAGLPLATAIKSVQVIDPTTGLPASVEVAMLAQKTVNDGIKTMYTAKLSNNGLIGGFGITNDGVEIEAGFDVGKFWIGRSDAKIKPFMIQDVTKPNGSVVPTVFINESVISSITFDKIRDATNNFVFENGKLRATYLNVNELNTGTYTSYAWPVDGNPGIHISQAGLLMGNYQGTGAYFRYDNASSTLLIGHNKVPRFYLDNSGLRINGSLTADAVNAINTVNIAGNAITASAYASLYTTHTGNNAINPIAYKSLCSLTSTLPDLSPATTAGTIIVCNISWYELGGPAEPVQAAIFVDGTEIAISACTLGESKTHTVTGFTNLTAGVHTIELKAKLGRPPTGGNYKETEALASIIIMSGKR